MGKKKSRKPIETKHKEAHNKYTLDTPVVKEFLDYVSTPEAFESGQKKHLDAFMKSHNIKTYDTLASYRAIDGFEAELTQRKNAFEADERIRLLKIAKTGLEKRAIGVKITKQALFWGKPVNVTEEVPPDPFSCVSIHKIYGTYEDKLKIESEDITEVKAAAARARQSEKK